VLLDETNIVLIVLREKNYQVERFRREKLADFKRIILDYIQMQIEYSKKVRGESSFCDVHGHKRKLLLTPLCCRFVLVLGRG
jgi:hypothetical protein